MRIKQHKSLQVINCLGLFVLKKIIIVIILYVIFLASVIHQLCFSFQWINPVCNPVLRGVNVSSRLSCSVYISNVWLIFSKHLLWQDRIHRPLYWMCPWCYCVRYFIDVTLDHNTDVIQRVTRCLRWLLDDLSAAELFIAHRTNNIPCLLLLKR